MRQVQELAQPRPSGLTPLLDFDPVVGTANRAQDRDEEDRFERMEPRRVRTARVLDLSEIEKHVVDGIGGIHGACLAERVDVGETHSTIQDTPIGTAPVDAIALARARWRIENETFNTLKNQGYHFEHNFGHGYQNLSVVFAQLMMLAFLVDQVQQLCCPLLQAAWAKWGSTRLLWEKMRALFFHDALASMRPLFEALFDGLKKSAPTLAIDSS